MLREGLPLFGDGDHRMDIAARLQGLGLERYVRAFRDNEIDWDTLLYEVVQKRGNLKHKRHTRQHEGSERANGAGNEGKGMPQCRKSGEC